MDQNFSIPNRPSVLKALRRGFQTMASHAYLIIMPILLDLVLLFSPHLTIEKFLNPLLQMIQVPQSASADLADLIQSSLTALASSIKDYSITSWLRSLPFGLPSLIASRISSQTPFGDAVTISLTEPVQVTAAFLFFTILGVALASVYYHWNAMKALPDEAKVRIGLVRKTGSLILIPFFSVLAILAIIVPLTLLVGLLTAINPAFGTLAYLVGLIAITNLLFPLLFTPHAIITGDKNIFAAAKESIFIYRKSGVFSSFFVITLLFASYLSERLWQAPDNNSLMLIVGIFGHAVISTALVLASFHFFKDAKVFALEMSDLLKSIGESQPPL